MSHEIFSFARSQNDLAIYIRHQRRQMRIYERLAFPLRKRIENRLRRAARWAVDTATRGWRATSLAGRGDQAMPGGAKR